MVMHDTGSSSTAYTAQVVLHMQVLNIVADRMPQILKMGVPVPDHVPFYMNNIIPEDHERQINNETQLSKPQCVLFTSAQNTCFCEGLHLPGHAVLCWACPA